MIGPEATEGQIGPEPSNIVDNSQSDVDPNSRQGKALKLLEEAGIRLEVGEVVKLNGGQKNKNNSS